MLNMHIHVTFAIDEVMVVRGSYESRRGTGEIGLGARLRTWLVRAGRPATAARIKWIMKSILFVLPCPRLVVLLQILQPSTTGSRVQSTRVPCRAAPRRRHRARAARRAHGAAAPAEPRTSSLTGAESSRPHRSVSDRRDTREIRCWVRLRRVTHRTTRQHDVSLSARFLVAFAPSRHRAEAGRGSAHGTQYARQTQQEYRLNHTARCGYALSHALISGTLSSRRRPLDTQQAAPRQPEALRHSALRPQHAQSVPSCSRPLVGRCPALRAAQGSSQTARGTACARRGGHHVPERYARRAGQTARHSCVAPRPLCRGSRIFGSSTVPDRNRWREAIQTAGSCLRRPRIRRRPR